MIDLKPIGLTIASRWRQSADRTETTLSGLKRFILHACNPVHSLSDLIFAPYLSSGLSIIGKGPTSYAKNAYRAMRHRFIEFGSFFDFLAVGTDNGAITQTRWLRAVIAKMELKLFSWDCEAAPPARNSPSDARRLVAGGAFDRVHEHVVNEEHLFAPLASAACAATVWLSRFHFFGSRLLHKSPFGTLASIIRRRTVPDSDIDHAAANRSNLSLIGRSTRSMMFSFLSFVGSMMQYKGNTALAASQALNQRRFAALSC